MPLSNTKILKILKDTEPGVRWMRRTKADNETDGPFFAGVIGREGIQFSLVKNYTPHLLRVTARAVAKRLREVKNG